LNTQTKANKQKKPNLDVDQLNEMIIDSIRDVKGKEIVKLDLRLLDGPADFFIICEGTSTTQVKAISDRIEKNLKDSIGLYPSHVEGTRNALWICMDYFNTVVHIFHPDTRSFYELENLWSDAKVTEYESL
jgi:ribosome-associated protein